MSSERTEANPPSGTRLPYEKPLLEFVEIFGEQVMSATCKASGTSTAPVGGSTGCAASSCTANGDS